MRKKIILIFLGILLCLTLTGCNVKFIEKVENNNPSETEETEDFGDIIIEIPSPSPGPVVESSPNPESTDTPETSDPITPSPVETEEPSSSPGGDEGLKEGEFEYGNMIFIRKEVSVTYWCKDDVDAKVSPSSSAKTYTSLKKGDFVTLMAVSKDDKWAMVSIYGGPSSFIQYEYLSEDEVIVQQEIEELPSPSPSPSEKPQVSSSPEPPSYETPSPSPSDEYTGIGYPSNASSTSFNMGVEFADVTITLTVRKDNTQISNGPDVVSNSTGYYSLGTLNKGDTVKCTGIGRNGYVRVSYGGQVGFIDSRYVEY